MSKTVILSTAEYVEKIDSAFDCGGVAALLSLIESISENVPADSAPLSQPQLLGILNLYVERMDPSGRTRSTLRTAKKKDEQSS